MIRFVITIALSLFLCIGTFPIAASAIPVDGEYKPCGQTSFDGIGKCYFGREISQVLGHEGFPWLERSTRSAEEKPERAIEALQFSPTDTVADIGAGVGYMSFLIAPQVAKVYAVDVQSEMLDMLRLRQSVNGLTNVETVKGEETTTNLAAGSVDWAIMVDAYHEFAYPKEMMTSIFSALKPGGKVVLFEYKGENPLVAIKPHHKMTQTQARAEVSSIGFEFVENKRVLPQQHVLVFRKPVA
jgi:protein-L-isoaspartate O-methyltransferase